MLIDCLLTRRYAAIIVAVERHYVDVDAAAILRLRFCCR